MVCQLFCGSKRGRLVTGGGSRRTPLGSARQLPALAALPAQPAASGLGAQTSGKCPRRQCVGVEAAIPHPPPANWRWGQQACCTGCRSNLDNATNWACSGGLETRKTGRARSWATERQGAGTTAPLQVGFLGPSPKPSSLEKPAYIWQLLLIVGCCLRRPPARPSMLAPAVCGPSGEERTCSCCSLSPQVSRQLSLAWHYHRKDALQC